MRVISINAYSSHYLILQLFAQVVETLGGLVSFCSPFTLASVLPVAGSEAPTARLRPGKTRSARKLWPPAR